MSNPAAHTLIVVPCAADKADRPVAARELYVSDNFAHALRAAELEAIDTERVCGVSVKVMILSARYGLVELDQVLAPYDLRMGQAGSISAAGIAAQLAELAPSAVMSMCPAAYRDRLAAAVAESNEDEDNAWIEFIDTYEAAPGIGYQRGVASSLIRTHDVLQAA